MPDPAPRPKTPAPAMPESKRTPVFAIAMVIGLIAFGYLMLKLPFEGDPKPSHRLGTGCIALFAAMIVYGGARTTVESVLKGLVEIVAVGLFLLNALAAALVWLWKQPLTDWAVAMDFGEEHAFAKVTLLIAAGAFVFDAVVFLLLYPLSRIVGTKLDIE